MGSGTFMKDTQVHAPEIPIFHIEVESHTCLKSSELVHNPGRVSESGTVPDVHVVFAVRAVQLEMEEGQVRIDRETVGLME